MKVKSESEVAQSCPTLNDLMDCSLPGSSIHGIFQARVLEWGAIAFSVNITRSLLFNCSIQWGSLSPHAHTYNGYYRPFHVFSTLVTVFI